MSVFHTEREFKVSPDRVFAAIQDPARLARWWGPEGFSNTFEVFEIRDGGNWIFVMHGPDGTDYPNQSAFIEIIPDALVRIRHVNLPHFDLSIRLEVSDVGTRLVWHAVFEDVEFAESRRSFLEKANEQNLDRLALELGATA